MKICAKIVGEKSMQSRTEVNFPAGFIAERLGVGVTDLFLKIRTKMKKTRNLRGGCDRFFPQNKDKNEKKGNIELTAICINIFVKRENIYERNNNKKREK